MTASDSHGKSTGINNLPTNHQRPSISSIYGVVMGVGIACAVALTSVFAVTRPVIERNRVAMRQKAILNVIPAATNIVAFQIGETVEPVTSEHSENPIIFAGFDDDQKLAGIAIETEGMGYQDKIRTIYGYAPESESIIGFFVLESRETPGLGDRIENDPQFLANFDSLDVTFDEKKGSLKNTIEFVKPGQKQHAWQIDGISGATISSQAIAEMLRVSAAEWVPKIQANLQELKIQQQENPSSE